MADKVSNKYFYGTGRRKTAVARVRISTGDGKCILNGKEKVLADEVILPLKVVGKTTGLCLSIKIKGGGVNGQNEAIRHGIARALIVLNPDFRSTLKKAGFLTRDQREVERKKPGLKKARRAPQWSKR